MSWSRASVLALVACGSAAPQVPASAPPSAPAPTLVRTPVDDGTYALVWWDAPLYRAPRLTAPSVRAVSSPIERKPGQVQTVKVIAELGEWLEIETLGSAFGMCHPMAASLEGIRATLFVRATDISTATTTGMNLTHDDSRIEIHPGTHAVQATPDARAGVPTFVLGGDGVAVTVELAASDVNRYFRPGKNAYVVPRTIRFGDTPTLDGLPIVDQRVSQDPSVAFCGLLVAHYATELEKPVIASPPRVLPPTAALVGPYRSEIVQTRGCAECVVEAGSRMVPIRLPGPEVYWEDGSLAGVSQYDVDVVDVRPSPSVTSQVCFAIRGSSQVRRLHVPTDRTLRLCADRASVRPPRR